MDEEKEFDIRDIKKKKTTVLEEEDPAEVAIGDDILDTDVEGADQEESEDSEFDPDYVDPFGDRYEE